MKIMTADFPPNRGKAKERSGTVVMSKYGLAMQVFRLSRGFIRGKETSPRTPITAVCRWMLDVPACASHCHLNISRLQTFFLSYNHHFLVHWSVVGHFYTTCHMLASGTLLLHFFPVVCYLAHSSAFHVNTPKTPQKGALP